MARDEDDDEGLPPLGESTGKYLDQAKKGQARNFLLVCKGTKVKYLAVRKKPIKKIELSDARKAGYKGEGYFGVITGKGMELVFNLSIADGYTSEPVKDKILKEFLEEKADFKCKPTFAIVATLPEIPFDDEDLDNPLIAQFLALNVPITQVLDIHPTAEGKLKQTTTEIRLLLQEGDFSVAEPRIVALETRLQAVLQGAPADVVPTAPPRPPEFSDSKQPSASSTTPAQDPMADLIAAMKKLGPLISDTIKSQAASEAELLSLVREFQGSVRRKDTESARIQLRQLGTLLKELRGGASTKPAIEDPVKSVEPATAFADKLRSILPAYKALGGTNSPLGLSPIR